MLCSPPIFNISTLSQAPTVLEFLIRRCFYFLGRLFGTYKEVPEARYNAMVIGLEEIRDERTSDFWWQIKSPIFRSLSMDMNEQQQLAKRDTLVVLARDPGMDMSYSLCNPDPR
jgi:hypothetical protein